MKPERRIGPDGVVRYRIRWRDENGRRRSETYTTESQALRAWRRRHVEVDDVRSGIAQPRAYMLVSEAFADWLEQRPAKRKKDDESRFRVHILPFFGDRQMCRVTQKLVDQFARAMEKKTSVRIGQKTERPLSPQTIKNCLTVLQTFLGAYGVTISARYKVPTTEYRWIKERDDVSMFLRACAGWFRIAAALALYAGLRKGEVAGLRRRSIDWQRKFIAVDHSYEGGTKGGRVRYVPMAPELETILDEWLRSTPGELVVPGITPETDLAQYAAQACTRAGIPPVNFHGLRHTFASHLALRSSISTVGTLLGHRDPKTTMRYAHIDNESAARDPGSHLAFPLPSKAEVIPIRAPHDPRPRDHRK